MLAYVFDLELMSLFFLQNPTYYGVEDVSPEGISIFLSMLVEETLLDLSVAGCIELGDENGIESTILGGIASYYYLSYKTAGILRTRLKPDYRAVGDASIGERPDGDFISMIRILAEVTEYNELPVRHNGK